MVEHKARFRRAVGLDYSAGRDDVPGLGVKGEFLLADKVVETARRFGVPVVEDPGLAQALSPLEIDQKIPDKLYRAVAVLLNHLGIGAGKK